MRCLIWGAIKKNLDDLKTWPKLRKNIKKRQKMSKPGRTQQIITKSENHISWSKRYHNLKTSKTSKNYFKKLKMR